jgi:hypothetical protein
MCLFNDSRKTKGAGFTPGVAPAKDTDTTLVASKPLVKDTDKPDITYGDDRKDAEGNPFARNPASSLAINIPRSPAANTSGVNTV